MRLIDADAVIEIVEDGLRNNPHEDGYARACHRTEYTHFLDVIHRMPTIAPPPNDPLTLEQLREMYGGEEGPIWIKFGVVTVPAVLDEYGGELMAVWSALGKDDALQEKDYGNTWLAYRRKPEEGTA